mgnify:CR=1 FL=1
MDEEIKNVQNEDGINEETAEETTANAEVEEEPIGNIKISVDVVSTIAGIATTEIDGVAECTERLPAVLPKCLVQRKSVKGR